ncbi:ABC transporter permease [Azomonas macrocytogenes]|uniref:NitT/TauT family transport system permease protein n=1 Tax=Azomonas macrocytogenes TaxID=69962 RepID=A0A839T335_AZOMA|nr:ABC transporter permease [Azomonas macrocytogenes]MBB3102774.1 NitT/TauT family transport system permease protein [Azomonas macrocytogenes]
MLKSKSLNLDDSDSAGCRTRSGFGRLRAWRRVALLVSPWLVLLLIWSAIRMVSDKYAGLIPSISSVLGQGYELLLDGTLASHWAASTLRVLGGVTLGVLLAIPAGFALGWYAGARRVMTPVLNFFRALPPIALIPLMIVYFGIGEPAKILVLVYAAFFTSVVVLYEGISRIQPIYINVARTLGASERELFVRVILPLALPHVLTASRVALGVGWMTLVASELISAQQGLGSMIQIAASYFQLETIYLGLFSIGFTAMLMDFLLVRLSARLVGWQEQVK